MRAPLITLILVYSFSILGFVLIPGVDDQGNVYRMDFLHAVYFVSFMGSTIGFGEIPYDFTAAQRMWTLLCIYATVTAWLYGIGSLLALVQEPLFLRIVKRRSFASAVKRMNEPFYLICGYGVTGSLVVRRLINRGLRVVVIEIDQDRVDELELESLPVSVPALCADASQPNILNDAGLQHENCIGVMALTDNDRSNLSVSISSKILFPDRMMISRTESSVTTHNLQSFGTDLVVDPFSVYAGYLSLAVHAPYMHLVYDWIHSPSHRPLSSVYKHTKGRWIVCGYGRFGRAIYEAFDGYGVEVTVVDINPEVIKGLANKVEGVGTEAVTLEEARVADAVGIIAGTDNDSDNLSIIITARELNPKLVTVVRQNINANSLIFKNSRVDFVMEPGRIIGNRILAHVKSPLLPLFVDTMLQEYDDVWAHTLINRMSSMVGNEELDSWTYKISEQQAPAWLEAERQGLKPKLGLLFKDIYDRQLNTNAFPLMLRCGDSVKILPGELERLNTGDEVLICGQRKVRWRMESILNNYSLLHYILTGDDASNNLLSRGLQWWFDK